MSRIWLQSTVVLWHRPWGGHTTAAQPPRVWSSQSDCVAHTHTHHTHTHTHTHTQHTPHTHTHTHTHTIHRTTRNKQYTEQHKKFGRVWAVPRLCWFYPGICLTTEENAWKNLGQGSRRVPDGTMKIHKHTIRTHRLKNKNT